MLSSVLVQQAGDIKLGQAQDQVCQSLGRDAMSAAMRRQSVLSQIMLSHRNVYRGYYTLVVPSEQQNVGGWILRRFFFLLQL